MDAVPKSLGDFRIESVLGQGGSGIVYDAAWGPRRVALKVLHPSHVGTGKERAQFLAEAQKLQQITHPSVVKVFSVGELPDGRPYLAMERLEGETLAAVVARGPIALSRALELFAELAGAVSALHAQGLVHRDLKPENVFVVAGQHAVLLDFGIAKDLASAPSTTTQDGHVRGTPAYMAPERFFGQPAGIPTDVYELALVLYAMLAGRLPWDEHGDPEARLAPRSLCELAPIAPALDVEVRRALSTRAQNRPASAGALLEAVRAAVGDAAKASADGDADPAMTAPMRAAREDARAEGVETPNEKPNERPNEQPTPLAWAPTEAARQSGTARRRTPWVWVAMAGAGVAAAGVGVGMKMSSGGAAVEGTPAVKNVAVGSAAGTAAGTSTGGAPDPWDGSGAPAETAKALPLVEPKLTPETYRAEAAAAIARLPGDTRFVFTAQIGELRANAQIDEMIGKGAKRAEVVMLSGMLPPCLLAMVSDSEWIAFGAPSTHDPDTGTLVLRGRWKRRDVESCLGDSMKPHVAHDGAKLFRISDDFWLDFIDEHTGYVTKHPELDAEHVHALVRHGGGPPAHARDLVGKLPADRSIAFVIDGALGEPLFERSMGMPKTSDLYGWVRVESGGVTLDVTADTKDAAAARAAAAKVHQQIDGVFGTAQEKAVGKLDVIVDKTMLHVRGNLTGLMLGLISAAL